RVWHAFFRSLLHAAPRCTLFPYTTLFRSVYHGHAMAKAGLEGAVWDLWARRRGQPLSRALGGFQRRVPAGVAVGFAETTDELLQRGGADLGQGYRRIKVKIEPGRGAGRVAAVRRRFPAMYLAADANGS